MDQADDRGWRSIATAPKDGTQIDVWCTPTSLTGGSYGRTPDCWFSSGKWWRHDFAFGDHTCRSEVANVTHWMPRPLGPKG